MSAASSKDAWMRAMRVREWSCDCAKKKYLEDIAVHLLQNEKRVGLETSARTNVWLRRKVPTLRHGTSRVIEENQHSPEVR